MKYLCYAFLCIIGLGMSVAQAQEFSSSLGGGGIGYTGVRRTMYTPRGQVVAPTVRKQQRRKKTIVKYSPNQVDLNNDQMEKLLPLMKRIQDGKVKSLDVVAIARDYNMTYHRETSLGRVFQSYTPNIQPNFRHISGPAVVDSNDNTVEFIEYY